MSETTETTPEREEDRVARWVAALGIEAKPRTLDEELEIVARQQQPTVHPRHQQEDGESMDWRKLPRRYHPKTLEQALDPVFRNIVRMAIRERGHNQPLTEWEQEELRREALCPICKGAGMVVAGHEGYRTLYRPCPDCEHVARQAARERINRRWPIRNWEQQLAAIPWLEQRPNAPAELDRPLKDYPLAPGAIAARRAQREFLSDLPSSRTLLLYGTAGVGKSRLLAEIAVEARARGLSSIYRTGEGLREILQSFPHDGEEPAIVAEKQKRLKVAWEDLTTADVVLVDEIDDIRGPAIRATLLDLLNTRIAAGLSTGFAGNDVLEKLPTPIVSRLTAANNLHVDMTGDYDARPWLGHGVL